jgi:hypothetical protein
MRTTPGETSAQGASSVGGIFAEAQHSPAVASWATWPIPRQGGALFYMSPSQLPSEELPTREMAGWRYCWSGGQRPGTRAHDRTHMLSGIMRSEVATPCPRSGGTTQ